jgi:hypothetical protein
MLSKMLSSVSQENNETNGQLLIQEIELDEVNTLPINPSSSFYHSSIPLSASADSGVPSFFHIDKPSSVPSLKPSLLPSAVPSFFLTLAPSVAPSHGPSSSFYHSSVPSSAPTESGEPSFFPSEKPSSVPS